MIYCVFFIGFMHLFLDCFQIGLFYVRFGVIVAVFHATVRIPGCKFNHNLYALVSPLIVRRCTRPCLNDSPGVKLKLVHWCLMLDFEWTNHDFTWFFASRELISYFNIVCYLI